MTRRDEIYDVLLAFVGRYRSTPALHRLWQEYMQQKQRSMAYGVFLRHIQSLEKEGRLRREDGIIILPDDTPPA